MAAHHVGGEVDAQCTKCKMLLAHTILAMVGERIARVRCNTCMGEHAFKAGPSEAKPRATRTSTGPRAASTGTRSRAQAVSFDDQMAGKDLSSAMAYSVNTTFAVDQVIDHPTFGQGYVSAARPDKIDVVFRSFVKTLVHGRGGKPAPARPGLMGRPEPEPEPEHGSESSAAEPSDAGL